MLSLINKCTLTCHIGVIALYIHTAVTDCTIRVFCNFKLYVLSYHSLQKAISRCYNVPTNQIRAYIHYHPTYYHLHIHFTALGYQAPGSLIGQSHLLEDVIDNIKNIDSHYYANRTMTFQVREDSPLLSLLQTQ